MAVRETGVSYYGMTYVEHAEKDFEEMLKHNCNSVLLAITECDMDFWYPNIIKIAALAKKMGLSVHLNLWGIGKFYGGEYPSIFLQNHIKDRQVTSWTDESVPAACISTKAFRQYFLALTDRLGRDIPADGFFCDEPHYELPSPGNAVPERGAGMDWTCRCEICRKMYQEEYGHDMPKILTPDVIRFRQDRWFDLLTTAARRIKTLQPKIKVTTCIEPYFQSYYATERRGYDDMERLGSTPEFDVFSTSIISWKKPWDWFVEVTDRTMEIARRYKKPAQRWVMNYYESPSDSEQIRRAVHLYADRGVDSIFAWTYRGGAGTSLAAPKAEENWRVLGEAYGEVRGK